jgi:capsular polysaccharide biosynthesis protein
MEMRRYVSILKRWWWLALPAFLVTTGLTLLIVLSQPPVYESRATFVVAPQSLNPDDAVNAFDTLIRGAQITSTYATIARSDLILARAEDRLAGSTPSSDITVGAEVETGTNVLEISVQGPDPDSAHGFAVAVAAETVDYVNDMSNAYALEPLDSPQVPRLPVGPQKELTIVLGGLFGLVLGGALALFAEYLNPSERVEDRARESRTSGRPLHDERSFRSRVRREVSRSKRSGHPFSFGVLKLATRNGANGKAAGIVDDPEPIADAFRPTLRRDDALAWLGEGTFAVLLPDTPAAEAGMLLSAWRATVNELPNGEPRGSGALNVSTGTCEYRDNVFVGDRETTHVAGILAGIDQATAARQQTEVKIESQTTPPARIAEKHKVQPTTWKKRPRGSGRRG